MESNDVFEAEAEIDALNVSTSSQRPLSKGASSSTFAYGAVSPPEHTDGENEPLLGRTKSRIHDASRLAERSKSGEREPPLWPGERDFEGVPWWKTPSVGLTTPIVPSLYSHTAL